MVTLTLTTPSVSTSQIKLPSAALGIKAPAPISHRVASEGPGRQGAIAQLVARLYGIQKVRSSNLRSSTRSQLRADRVS